MNNYVIIQYFNQLKVGNTKRQFEQIPKENSPTKVSDKNLRLCVEFFFASIIIEHWFITFVHSDNQFIFYKASYTAYEQ